MDNKTENLYTPNCIRTVSGIYVNVFDPKPEMFCINDIAHALSHQCRFGGHLPMFYSVAQHSINCALLINDPALKLDCLLHDASEAYLLDIPSPIKSGLSNYKEIENNLMVVISSVFRIKWPLLDQVKEIDKTMLEVEWDCLMLRNDEHKLKIKSPFEVKDDFISLFQYCQTLKPPTNE